MPPWASKLLMRTLLHRSIGGSSMHLPLMEKFAERFDEVFAGVNMNWFELQRSEQRISLGRLAPGKFFVGPAIRPAECIEHHHLARLGIAKANEADIRHFEFTLVGNYERYDIVFAARDFKSPFVTGILKIAYQKHNRSPRGRTVK